MSSRCVTVIALALVAYVATARADVQVTDHAALRDVLGEAPTIVRASASETTSAGTTDTRVLVLETLRGAVDGDTIIVRQPAGEEPLARGEDAILLLDARAADGAYPLHHPAGRYRVETGADGDVVIVNANGIDGAAVSPKDLRPRAPDERIPLATFRTIAGPAPKSAPAARPGEPALTAPQLPAQPPATTASPAVPAEPTVSERGARWPWVLFGICLGLAVAVFARRRRRR